jgi:hypothetical protein
MMGRVFFVLLPLELYALIYKKKLEALLTFSSYLSDCI